MKVNFANKDTIFNIRVEFLICLFLVATTLAVYWQARNHEFVFDDSLYVSDNKHIQAGLTKDAVKWAFSVDDNEKTYWHPLTWISHIVDIQLFGMNAGSHILTNVLFHLINSLLLFFVFRLMTGEIWKSAFVAGLFALHPINVESVAWIAERKNVLSTFFWMLTLLAYVYYAQKPNLFKYILTFSAFTLGLMAKPMLVTLPCVLLLMDFWPLGRFRLGQMIRAGDERTNQSGEKVHQASDASRLFLEKLPFFGVSAIVIYLSSLSVQRPGVVITMQAVPLALRIENAAVSYIRYIGKLFWPIDLAVFYPYPATIPGYQVLGAAFLLVGVTIVFSRALKKMPFLLMGWLWCLGTLVPTIGFVQVGLWPAMADRWAYIPFIGLFIIIVWGSAAFFESRKFKKLWLASLGLSLLVILSLTTWKQIRIWHNSLTLFQHTVDVTANNYVANNNLGSALAKRGMTEQAIIHFSEALRLLPGYEKAHFNLAGIHNNIGNALKMQNKLDEAIRYYSQALSIKPDFEEPHNNLGLALLQRGRLEEAKAHFRKALQIRPGYPDAHKNLKITSDVLRKIDTAVSNLKQALVIIPQDPLLPEKIERLNKGKRELDNVIDRFIKALSLQPGFDSKSFDINNLTRVHLIKQEYDQRLSLFEEVIKVQPNSAGAYYHIACIYARQNNTKESLDWLNQAIERGFVNWELLRTDRDLENIRYTSFYKQLVERH
jgi:tetratricopeptide (TPR) repeat protein